ncbi:unnamed protein product [Allacma fusca]|uniref:Cilia- and flagella-associated protein 69 ARM repeats domain-containing protein n=1 Tax=Allacma fusca TaxID=39272 RepID=A0A8J2L0U9_9HEXA|nr:unnamed protein product [Allacma fusca]
MQLNYEIQAVDRWNYLSYTKKMSAVSLCTLPNFADIDSDICIKIKNCKYSAPPNSITQSCASRSSLNICCNQTPSGDFHVKSLNRDGEFTRVKPTRGNEEYDFNITTRLPPPRKLCIPTPCQIPKEPLEFITRELGDSRWNSTYCLERISTILDTTILTANEMGSRIEEIWKFYLKKSPQGVFLRDIHEISKIIRQVDIGSPKMKYADEFLHRIFEHLKKGIRIRSISENNCTNNLRLTFDGFSRALTFGSSHIRPKILQTLISWLEFYTVEKNQKAEMLRPKCEDIRMRATCWKNEWKATPEGKLFQEPVRCEAYRNFNDNSETETKCVANCKIFRPKKPVDIVGNLSKSSFFGALESSILPSTLEQLCHLQEFDEEYVLKLIIIKKLCEQSYCIRSCVVNSSILDVCLLKLGYPDTDLKILCRTIELLYILLSFNCGDYNGIKIFVVPNQESFEMLLYRFMNQLLCSSTNGSQLRNDMALIIYLLALECPQLRTAFSGHVRDFASILANNILTEEPFEILLDSTPEDLEFIQFLIWILDLVIPADPQYYKIIENYQLIPVMMRLIIGPCTLVEEAGIDTAAVTAVARAASKALVTYADIQPLLFLQPEGILPILNTLSIFGARGQVSVEIVEAFLDVAKVLLTRGNSEDEDLEELLLYFTEKKGMECLAGVLKYLTSYDNFVVSIEPLICKALFCCSELGKYDELQKDEFANKKGVKTIIRLIHQVLYTQAQVRHMNPVLHIMIAECIWNCIADCPTGLEIFLLYEGMFRLLELFEIAASSAVQYHILGVLLELIDYSRCRDQLVFWHRRMRNLTARFAHSDTFTVPLEGRLPKPTLGDDIGSVLHDNDQSLASFLCEIWRDEEKRLGVMREDDGTIKSLEFPLMSAFSRNYNRKLVRNRPSPASSPGPASLDLLMCTRPRIYLLIKAIIEETNTEASVFAGLGVKNQVTMKIIVNFLDLKVSEIWMEMNEEIQAEGLTLVKSDAIGMDILLKISRNKIATVMSTQRYLIQRGTEQAAMNERELYRLLRNCQLQDHLMALREAQYYATLSDYFLLVDRRLLQQTVIHDLYLRKEVASVVKNKPRRSKKRFRSLGSDDIDKDSLDLGDFGYSIDLKEPDDSSDFMHLPPPLPSELRSDDSTPMSVDENRYQVSPEVLFKALTKVVAQQNQWKAKNIDEETEWLMRKKWHPEWYPKALEHA